MGVPTLITLTHTDKPRSQLGSQVTSTKEIPVGVGIEVPTITVWVPLIPCGNLFELFQILFGNKTWNQKSLLSVHRVGVSQIETQNSQSSASHIPSRLGVPTMGNFYHNTQSLGVVLVVNRQPLRDHRPPLWQ